MCRAHKSQKGASARRFSVYDENQVESVSDNVNRLQERKRKKRLKR